MSSRPPVSWILFQLALCALVAAFATGVTLWVSSVPKTADPRISSLTDPLLAEEERATISVVEHVSPAVVSIAVKRPRRVLGRNMSSEGSGADTLIQVGGGTGFFVTGDGYVVTNRHVVDEENQVFVVITDSGRELSATLIATDPILDLAVLKVDGGPFPMVSLGDSDGLQVGQTVIAIGNTLSEYQNTVTKGVISGLNRRVAAGMWMGRSEIIEQAIQTDAAINPGNSGGPLINLSGNVIGVNTAVNNEGEAIGFAIPSNDVARVVSDIRQFGRIVRPWLGVRYIMLTPDIASQAGLDIDHGAWISGGEGAAVLAGSPAEQAGVKDGDIIVSINGQALSFAKTLSQSLAPFHPADHVELLVRRGGADIAISVVLQEADPKYFK
ncbi:trypsin-like peptidase domain-containing protein [Candidatus Uhrbacteria bacterium]|nr:trypsin-like peptidase domain-containing protein [Candidatus Uhrbacteria bacterium]